MKRWWIVFNGIDSYLGLSLAVHCREAICKWNAQKVDDLPRADNASSALREEDYNHLESLPWDSLADVPLDAWFLTKSEPLRLLRILDIHVPRGTSSSSDWVAFNGYSARLHELHQHGIEWSRNPVNGPWYRCNKRFTQETVL